MFLPQLPLSRSFAPMTSVSTYQCLKTFAATLAAAFLAVPASAQMPVAATETVEFPDETAAIVAATANLFDAIEQEGAPNARRPVISGPVVAVPASLPAHVAKAGVLTSKGPVGHLTGYRISWYPVDRFLGAVDFMGTWDGNRNLVCGYVTWDLSDPDAPVLDTVSATFLDVQDLSGQSDEDVQAALLDANCAYGAIDANYAFFE